MSTCQKAVVGIVALLLALVTSGTVMAQAGRGVTRTPWGDPDLQGTYTSDNSIGVPFARPQQFGTRAELTDAEFAERERANAEQIVRDQNDLPESKQVKDDAPNNAPRHWLERPASPSRATSLIVDPPDGRVPPMTQQGQQRLAERQAAQKNAGQRASYADFSNYDRCITRGLIGSILPVIYGNSLDITQSPGGRRHPQRDDSRDARDSARRSAAAAGRQAIQNYMGFSRGRWEGNILVVETTNFTDRTQYRHQRQRGNSHSAEMRVTERYIPGRWQDRALGGHGGDPQTWTKPWTFGLPSSRATPREAVVGVCVSRGQLRASQHAERRRRRGARTLG